MGGVFDSYGHCVSAGRRRGLPKACDNAHTLFLLLCAGIADGTKRLCNYAVHFVTAQIDTLNTMQYGTPVALPEELINEVGVGGQLLLPGSTLKETLHTHNASPHCRMSTPKQIRKRGRRESNLLYGHSQCRVLEWHPRRPRTSRLAFEEKWELGAVEGHGQIVGTQNRLVQGGPCANHLSRVRRYV